jgi:hypothetical protein
MADLDIMRALKDPKLQFQTLLKSPAAETTTEVGFNDKKLRSTLQEMLNDFDSEQYVEDSDSDPPLPELPQMGATYTSLQESLCMVHDNSTYERTKLELLAIENWMELLQTQTKSCIFLAKGNWQARQAATAISMAKGRKTCILSEKTCWACIGEQFLNVEKNDQMVTFIA